MKALFLVLVGFLILSSCSSDANMEVIVKVDYSPVFTKMARGNNPQFQEVLDATKSDVTNKHFVDVFFENAKKMHPEIKFRNYFEWKYGIKAGMSDSDVKNVMKQRCDAAMDKMIKGMKINFPETISFKGVEHLNHSKLKLALKTNLSDKQLVKYLQSVVDLRFYRTINFHYQESLRNHIRNSLNPTVSSEDYAENEEELPELIQHADQTTMSASVWQEFMLTADGKYAECRIGLAKELVDSLNHFEKENNNGRLQYFAKKEDFNGSPLAFIYACPAKPNAEVALTGKHIINARSEVANNGEFVVTIEFNSTGSKMFAQLSAEEIGKPILIVMNGEVISAPFVNQPIHGGKVQISGGFDEKEAEEMAVLLNKGKWALPCKVLSVKKLY